MMIFDDKILDDKKSFMVVILDKININFKINTNNLSKIKNYLSFFCN